MAQQSKLRYTLDLENSSETREVHPEEDVGAESSGVGSDSGWLGRR